MRREGAAISGHIVVAPDKFKGSLSAPEVAARVIAGLGDRVPAVALPVADGGDGTVEAAVACGFARVEVKVSGPDGEPVTAAYAWRSGDGHPPAEPSSSAASQRDAPGEAGSPAAHPAAGARTESPVGDAGRETSPDVDGPLAVIELAEASGLRRLSAGKAPLTATSHGTGELIAHALRRGARRIVLGLGGSACTDGGAGMLQALGARLLDDQGRELPPGGAALRRLARIDVSGLLAFARADRAAADAADTEGDRPAGAGTAVRDIGVEFVVAVDVDNPLLGPQGAAAVYGPQKGASQSDVAILEAGLSRFARIAAEVLSGPSDSVADEGLRSGRGGASPVAGAGGTSGASRPPYGDRPGAGAAGGVGFAAMAFLGARPEPGIRYLLDLLRFDEHLDGARLVITGEGSLDAQSLRGKAPVGVAEAAGRRGIPVIAVCGRRTLTDERLQAAGIRAAYALTDLEPDPAVCMAEAGPLLERLAARIAATEPELRG